MYDTKYNCRYQKDDIFLKDDNVSDEEKEYIRAILYQEDYLNIFSLKDYNDSDVNKSINDLYEKIKDSDVLKDIIKKAAESLMITDSQIGLCILYSYDYMYRTHYCVSEYLDTGFISLDNIDNLCKIIK